MRELFRALPYTSDSSKPFWLEAFALAAELDDPLLLQLEEIGATWKVRPRIAGWFQQRNSETLDAIRASWPGGPPALGAEARALLERIREQLTSPAESRAEQTEENLLAGIWSHPDDDGPRLVYADFCQERGDERGEFIALQYKDKLTAADRKRVKALLTAHEREWIGPIEPVVAKKVVFERGFPSVVTVRFKHAKDVVELGDHPAWATCTQLSYGDASFPAERHKRPAVQHVPASARTAAKIIGPVGNDGLRGMLEAGGPWSVEELHLRLDDLRYWKQLCDSDRFPTVRRLYLRLNSSFDLERLWTASIGASLTVLGIHGRESVRPFYEACWSRPLDRLILGQTNLALTHGPGGRFSEAELTVDRRMAYGGLNFHISRVLDLPPKALTRLVVKGRVTREQEDEIVAFASEHQRRLAEVVLPKRKLELEASSQSWAGVTEREAPSIGLPQQRGVFRSVAWTTRIIAVSDGAEVLGLDPDTGQLLWRSIVGNQVTGLCALGEHVAVSAEPINTLVLDGATGEERGHSTEAFACDSLIPDADGSRFLVGSPRGYGGRGENIVFDDSAQPLPSARREDFAQFAANRSPDGRLVAALFKNRTVVRTVDGNAKVATIELDSNQHVFSPCGSVLAIKVWRSGEQSVHLVDTETWQELNVLSRFSFIFSPDGAKVLVVSETLEVYDTRSAERLATWVVPS